MPTGPEKISQMPNAAPLTGPELVELVQAGVNVQSTAAAIAGLLSTPVYDTESPAAGTYDDIVLPGQLDYTFDVDTSAGPVTITGWVPQRDGQRVTYSVTGANDLTFDPLTGSAFANQIRMSAPLSIVESDTLSFKYSAGAQKWLAD